MAKTLHFMSCGICSVVSNSLWLHGLQSTKLLSMGFCRWEYWSGLPFPTPGILCGFHCNFKNGEYPNQNKDYSIYNKSDPSCCTYSGSENKGGRRSSGFSAGSWARLTHELSHVGVLTAQDDFPDHTPIWEGQHAQWVGLDSAQNPAANCSQKPHLCGSVWKGCKVSPPPLALTEAWSQRGKGPSQPLQASKYLASREKAERADVSSTRHVLGSSFLLEIPSQSSWTKSEGNQHPPPSVLFSPQLFFGGTQSHIWPEERAASIHAVYKCGASKLGAAFSLPVPLAIAKHLGNSSGVLFICYWIRINIQYYISFRSTA